MVKSSRRNDFAWADGWNYVWGFSKKIIMDIFHVRVSMCFNYIQFVVLLLGYM